MMRIKKFLKDVTGITAIEKTILQKKMNESRKAEADRIRIEKVNEEIKKQKAEERKKKKEEKLRKQAEEEARLTPKERATKNKEPWVDAKLNVNRNDVRYGFYEIDWNEFWVLKLKQAGYGTDGDPDEDIIARWLRDVSASVAAEEGIDMTNRDVGYINIVRRDDGKSEVS